MNIEKESLEERAKRLLKLEIMKEPKKMCYLLNFQSLEEDIPVFNYLVKKGYAVEEGQIVKFFHYRITPEGVGWALN